MKHALAVLGGIAILTPGAAPPQADVSQRPVFRAAAEAVLVPVAVTEDRNPIAGLRAEDFELYDNGVRQTVEVLDAGTVAVDVTVVLGTASERERDRLDRSRLRAETLQSFLQPPDRLRIITAGARPRDLIPLQAASESVSLGGLGRTPGSSDRDSLFYAFARPVEAGRRHLVVMFTSGRDTWSTLPARDLPELAERADVVIHVVLYDRVPGVPVPAATPPRTPSGQRPGGNPDPPGSWMPPRMGENRRTEPRNSMMTSGSGHPPGVIAAWRETYDALRDVAARTGGQVHWLWQQADVFERILDEFRSSYLLRYTPEGVERSGWHELEVKIARPGSFDVRTRRGYEGG
jgi:hypothetical protein